MQLSYALLQALFIPNLFPKVGQQSTSINLNAGKPATPYKGCVAKILLVPSQRPTKDSGESYASSPLRET
ncbi:hypothetical protein EMIT0P253_160018 [Pseudomonas sp. IT-P253]